MGKRLSRFIFEKIWGWELVGDFPKAVKKFVVVVAPHTSNWDFPLGLLVRSITQRDIKFIAKDSLFRPPFGWLFRALGGYPVDRSKSTNFVDAVVDIFNAHESFCITITPEGTRKKAERLRTGFYYIALNARVPLVWVRFDYKARQVTIHEPFHPTGNLESDLATMLAFFRTAEGKHPEKGLG